MTRIVLVGGGTAGHVNPLLAVADELVRSHVATAQEILVVGTAEGLESRLVPQAGYTLLTTLKLPFPRRLSVDAVLFWPKFLFAVVQVMVFLRRHKADVLAGFGGYASAPGYVAAWASRIPFVVHEANAVPGFANRWGAKLTTFSAVAFSKTRIPHARVIGMPMARSITHPVGSPSVSEARSALGLSPRKKTLLVTGGSQGSTTINSTVVAVVEDVLSLGWQVLHIVGQKNTVPTNLPDGYRAIPYCDEMDLALRAATAVVSRAGASTVSEIQLMGLPAIFVPYPVGNGEQEKNADDSLRAGAAVLVRDRDFTPDYVRQTVIPLLGDDQALERMKQNARHLGRPDAAATFAALIVEAVTTKGSR